MEIFSAGLNFSLRYFLFAFSHSPCLLEVFHATPCIFSLYQTCINFYNVMKSEDNVSEEKTRTLLNIMQANRNEYFVFIRQNTYKCGLNSVSNRLRSVSNIIKKDWLLVDRNLFKTLCKKNVIQAQLLLL